VDNGNDNNDNKRMEHKERKNEIMAKPGVAVAVLHGCS
jgi:hypothetical protein